MCITILRLLAGSNPKLIGLMAQFEMSFRPKNYREEWIDDAMMKTFEIIGAADTVGKMLDQRNQRRSVREREGDFFLIIKGSEAGQV